MKKFIAYAVCSLVLLTAIFTPALATPRKVVTLSSASQDVFDQKIRSLSPTLWLKAEDAITDADVEILTATDAFDNAAWTPFKATVAADATTHPLTGSTTVDLVTENSELASSHYIRAATAPTYISGDRYLATILAKSNGRDVVRFYSNTSTDYSYANFTLTGNGSVAAASNATATIKSLSNGWYELQLDFIAESGGAGLYAVYFYNGGLTYDGDGTSGVYLASASLKRLSPRVNQIDSKTGSISFTQSTDANKPILSRSDALENLAIKTDNLDSSTYWTVDDITISTGETDPLGGSDAFSLTTSGGSSQHYVTQASAYRITLAAGTYHFSAYIKPVDTDENIFFGTYTTGHIGMVISATDGSVLDANGFTNTSSVSVGSGWYFVEADYTYSSAGAYNLTLGFTGDDSASTGSSSFDNDGLEMHAYGIQRRRQNMSPTVVINSQTVPIYGSTTGHKGLVFDGSDDYLQSTSILSDIVNADTFEWFVVVSANDTSSASDTIFTDSSGYARFRAVNGIYRAETYDTAYDQAISTLAFTAGKHYVLNATLTGGNLTIRDRTSEVSVAAGDIAVLTNVLRLGASTASLDGTIDEFLSFNKVLTTADRDYIIQGYKSRYGVN